MLFVYVMLQGSVLDSLALWNQFVEQICDDLKYAIQNIFGISTDLEHSHLNYDLHLLNEGCFQYDQIIAFFGLPASSFSWGNIVSNNFIQAELAYDSINEAQECDDVVNRMNSEQQRVFVIITSQVESSFNTVCFFLHNLAGIEKTFLYTAICHHFQAQGKVVLCVTASDIAALLLPEGTTAHFQFKIPIKCFQDSVCSIQHGTNLA